MEPIPFVVPQSTERLMAFRERIRRNLRLSETRRAGPLPLAYVGHLLEELAHAVGDEGVGLRIGGASRFEDVPLGRDVAGSLSVGAALAAAARTSSRYVGGQHLSITSRGDDVSVQHRFPDALRQGRRQGHDFALQLLIDVVRRGAGPAWRPLELHLEGPPPAHAEQLAALTAGATHFDAAVDRLVFPRSVLALPLHRSPRPCGPASAPLPDVDFVESVRRTILCLLEVGELSLPNVAQAAGTSARSLQRRLAASGRAFWTLVDEARFEVASRLLRDSGVRITDIAAELGYSDAANFTRAFRRWAGVSPLAFRRAIPLGLEGVAG